MTTRTTKTEYDYYEDGSVKRITITERDYVDGGPVGPSDLPKWHPWRVGDYVPERHVAPLISNFKTSGVAVNIDADQLAAIINGGTPTRVTGE